MRDEQVRRYARHILLPDVGGVGQTALLAATARVELRDREAEAERIAALYLAAGGVGKIVLAGATPDQVTRIAARGGDIQIVSDGAGRELDLPHRPPWWPAEALHDADSTALAFWRGGLAAVRWMAGVANP